MTNDNQQRATQIAINFGPVNGHIKEQHIHPVQPTAAAGQAYDAPDGRTQGSAGAQSSPQHSAGAQTSPNDAANQQTSPQDGAKLSIGQAVIFFSALLGEPLEQGYGQHKTRLAELISQVTGYKAGSVRQKIMEIGRMDVYPHHIQQDAEMVAKIIQPYNAQAASDIRITYLDE